MAEGSNEQEQGFLQFHFIKSNFFRVIHADGAFGGVGPRGTIGISLFSERIPIPQVSQAPSVQIGENHVEIVGDEMPTEGKVGVVREVEAHIIMSPEAAKNFHTWLGKHLAIIEAKRK